MLNLRTKNKVNLALNCDYLCCRGQVTIHIINLFLKTFVQHFICFIKHQHLNGACPQHSASYHIWKKFNSNCLEFRETFFNKHNPLQFFTFMLESRKKCETYVCSLENPGILDNSTAEESHSVGWKLFHLFTGFSMLHWCLQTWVK